MKRLLALLALAGSCASSFAADIELRALSFNIWHSDTTSAATRDNIVRAIRAAGANLVVLQELDRPADGQSLRAALGPEWRLHHLGGLGYLTPFPILATSPAGRGVLAELSPGHEVWLFNAHHSPAPYGPYQLLGIPYYGGPLRNPHSAADLQALIADQGRRVQEARTTLADIQATDALRGGQLVLGGDFNEPSALDWTPRAAAAGLYPVALQWPTSRVYLQAGLRDAWRTVYPDEVAFPGATWSPHYGPTYRENTYPPGVTEPQDRIDRLYFQGDRLRLEWAALLGPQGDTPSAIQYGIGSGYTRAGEFPSDHRGVLARFRYLTGNSTTLTFSGLPHNPGNANALNAGYGDYTAATPDVAVSFAGSHGAFWDTYDSRLDGLGLDTNWNGGVAQLQGGGPGRPHALHLSTRRGALVSLQSFRLLDYMNWSRGHTVRWTLRNGNGHWLAAGTVMIPENAALTVHTGVAQAHAGLVLWLEHLDGDNSDLAIDDVRFVSTGGGQG